MRFSIEIDPAVTHLRDGRPSSKWMPPLNLRPIAASSGVADGAREVPFEDMAKEIDAAVAELPPAVQVISEPGRFFAQSCGTLMAQAPRRSRDAINDVFHGLSKPRFRR